VSAARSLGGKGRAGRNVGGASPTGAAAAGTKTPSHPLSHGHRRDDVIGAVGGRVGHVAAVAGAGNPVTTATMGGPGGGRRE
jgi:hypothetical protein